MAKIYPQELADGLGPLFEKPLSVAYTVILAKADKTGKVKNINNIVGKLHEDDFLYEYPSILVTAGIWNKNDQVFDKYEVWKAKYTPLNKPANLNHEPDKVVGHTSRVFAITDETDSKEIPDIVDGKPNKQIPDIYHLLTVDNFYKYNIKAYQAINGEYSTKIQKIYDKIVDGELSVSMECIFSNFDYAILYPNGEQKIIERNEHTSFLSKKLRKFGGSGEYQGKRIGLLMRDIMFTGKGITDNPANEASVIFSKDSLAFATQNYIKSEDIFIESEKAAYISNDNGEEKMKLEEALAKITELETALAEANKSKTELEAIKAELATVKGELTSASEKLSKAEDINKESVVALETASKAVETANKTIEDFKGKLATAESDLTKVKGEKTKIERVQKIKDTLSLSAEESECNYLVVATLEEKAFDAWLTNTKKIIDSKSSNKGDSELAKAKLEADVKKKNEELAKEELEKAKAEQEAALATAASTQEETKNKRLKSVQKVFKND